MPQKQIDRLRDMGDDLGREAHPDATDVHTNPHHQEGPVVEVFKGNRLLGLYRLVGWEA